MTRRLLWALPAALMLGVTTAFAQTGARAPDAALEAAMEARRQALRASNAAEWAKYTTDDFVNITNDGVIVSKKERMAGIAAAPPNPKAVPASIESVRMVGPDTAVVIQRTANNVRLSEVWVKQAGAWKVASVQGTPITKK